MSKEHDLDEMEAEASIEGGAVDADGTDDAIENFLPEVPEGEDGEMEAKAEETEGLAAVEVEGTELEEFESAQIEELEFVEDEQIESIIESILFASDRPVGLGQLKLVFKGTNVGNKRIKETLNHLAVEYAGGRRGVTLEEVPGGWQLRTKVDNMEFLRRTLKTRTFRVSGPALEVLSIVAYKQPVIKHEIDEIRGVESGHLLRALMEKGLVNFEGKSDLPGRPMLYATTRRFLEIFGLRNLKELPTLSQIDELLPEGIGEEVEEKPTLAQVTDSMSENYEAASYSTGEEELNKIQEQIEQISTSSEFFEQEKKRQAEKRDFDRAQNIRDALAVDEAVSKRELNWLKKYDEALAAGAAMAAGGVAAASGETIEAGALAGELEQMSSEVPAVSAQSDDESDDSEDSDDSEPAAGASFKDENPDAEEEEDAMEMEGRFEEDAPHPEDELGEDIADIDGEDEGREGEANL